MAAEVGEPAPDFTLAGSDNTDDGRRDYSLAEYRGQVVVLVFYPGDNTPVCTRQLNSYTEDIDSFTDAGAQVLAICPQSVAEPRRLLVQAGRLRLPAARRHRQGGRRGLRHPRARSASTAARRS